MSIINIERITNYKVNETIIGEFLKKSLEKVDNNISYFEQSFPNVSQNLIYSKEVNKGWTASFFPGMTYLAYGITKDEKFLRNKDFYLNSFEERFNTDSMQNHDIGFLYTLSCVACYKLLGDKRAKEIAKRAAKKLALRYNPIGKYIQAWHPMGAGVPDVKIIIDCMMNLPLLYWMSVETGDNSYKDIAMNHALTSGGTLVREDGSTFHTYLMDPVSGRAIVGRTHQGRYDETTWARGQAWSVYGFTLSYIHTKNEVLLQKAIQSADYFINNQPENFVSYWDFSFTDVNPDIRDTSASSTCAAGLIELAKLVSKEQGEIYLKAAKIILQQLCLFYFAGDESNGLLKEGMYHRNNGFNECNIWGDYFYLEALCKLKGMDMLFW